MAATASPRSLTLALVTRRYPPLLGGAETMIRYLAQALAEEGAAVTVVTSRFGAARSSPERERVATVRGSLEVVRLGTSPLRFLGTWMYMRRLRHWLRDHPPDLAYVSMLKHDAFVAVEVGRERGFPVVLRPEGAAATGDVAWQAWGRFGRRIAERCRQADQFVAISQAIHDELLRAAGYDRARISDLPNGVPVPAHAWQRRDGWKEQPVAVSVGRLAPEKGHADLLAAWPAVRDRFPAARLVVVGEGPERPHLEELLSRHRLRESVTLAGARADVEPYLRNADLFVLPSREEGMSLALLEAMALGMPLVATAIPGNRKLVADFKQGRLSRAEDPSSLARLIVEQFSDMDRAIHMGRAARSLVQQKFAIAAVARQHLDLFERLIATRSGR